MVSTMDLYVDSGMDEGLSLGKGVRDDALDRQEHGFDSNPIYAPRYRWMHFRFRVLHRPCERNS